VKNKKMISRELLENLNDSCCPIIILRIKQFRVIKR